MNILQELIVIVSCCLYVGIGIIYTLIKSEDVQDRRLIDDIGLFFISVFFYPLIIFIKFLKNGKRK